MKILGVMSGSSLDGLDMALCDFDIKNGKCNWSIVNCQTIPLDSNLVDKIQNYQQLSFEEILILEKDFVKFCASEINAFLKEMAKPDYISWHGHTLLHLPEKGITYQMGRGSQLVALTDISTISDFRNQDIQLGGKGTPLVPISEKLLFTGYDYYLNLGGIANLSVCTENGFKAFDVCPCNQVLNALAAKEGKQYDDNGAMARNGALIEDLLEELDRFAFYQITGPKSLDNNWIKSEFIPKLLKYNGTIADLLCTMTEHIAHQINVQIQKNITSEKDKKLLVTGGGAYNGYLIERIQDRCKNSRVKLVLPDAKIIEFKEAILMALLGALRVGKETNVLSKVTGASANSCSGGIYYAKLEP